MKKLQLNLDELSVDSFEPSEASGPAGTVVGQGSILECGTGCIRGAVYCVPETFIRPDDGDGGVDDGAHGGVDGGYDLADPFSPEANEDLIW
jgi:hypothetical protein